MGQWDFDRGLEKDYVKRLVTLHGTGVDLEKVGQETELGNLK